MPRRRHGGRSQVLFWLLAGSDGHAKNFSIKLLAGGRYPLTPLYSVMSIWSIEGGGANQYAQHKARLALALLGKNKHYRFAGVRRRHFNSTAAKCFLCTDAEDVIERVLARTNAAVDALAAPLFADFAPRVAYTIFAGIVRNAKLLGDMQRTRRPAQTYAEILPLPDTAFRAKLYFLVGNLICLAKWPGSARSGLSKTLSETGDFA